MDINRLSQYKKSPHVDTLHFCLAPATENVSAEVCNMMMCYLCKQVPVMEQQPACVGCYLQLATATSSPVHCSSDGRRHMGADAISTIVRVLARSIQVPTWRGRFRQACKFRANTTRF